jgi:hypothetical protein
MMRRIVKTVSAVLGGAAALASLVSLEPAANAQEIQLTGPLAGAPPVRKARLHRAGRFEVAVGSTFTLLDQYLHTVMPGGTLTYNITDWIGVGVFGGYGLQVTTGLTDNLGTVINDYNCSARLSTKSCQLTAVNLVRNGAPGTNPLVNSQLGHITWTLAPQVVAVPFRGKISFFGVATVDTDVDIFLGAAFVGVKERTNCGLDQSNPPQPILDANGKPLSCSDPNSVQLASRVAIAPTFGLGLNFYPASFFGLGFEFRALPFAWNTSGFDNHGGGANGSFPDNSVNGADREFHFNPAITVHLKFAFPVSIKQSD